MASTVEKVDPSASLYAQGFAALLLARTRNPALASFHGKRSRDLEENSEQTEASNQHCKRCGTVVVPGVTGAMRLQGAKRASRNRRRSPTLPRKSELAWTCQCGWQSEQARPNLATKKRFKKRKVSDIVAPVSQASIPQTMEAELASPVIANDTATSTDDIAAAAPPQITPSRLPSPSRPAKNTVPTSTAPILRRPKPQPVPVIQQPFSPVSRAPAPSALPAATVADQPASRKKRTKREGLQALLAARKESEIKEQKGGTLGLGSFLQGL